MTKLLFDIQYSEVCHLTLLQNIIVLPCKA